MTWPRDSTPETRLPVSVLISPTLLRERPSALKDAGADKIGVALDLATPELFERYRGAGSGPHHWRKYWEILEAGPGSLRSPQTWGPI